MAPNARVLLACDDRQKWKEGQSRAEMTVVCYPEEQTWTGRQAI